MADGSNAETAIGLRVTQSFEDADTGSPSRIDADSVNGYGINDLYSSFISITVPASSLNTNSEGLFYASVSVPGMSANKAIMGIQMDYDTSIDAAKNASAYSWDFLETGENLVTFYGSTQWTSSFTILGVVVKTANSGGES